ncbi:MAG: hypothetical protein ABI813_05310 [Bacteroidota bacterium]
MEENIHLKNRLSEILKADFNASLLPDLEFYQTSFIHTDTRVNQLRSELAGFEKLLGIAALDNDYAEQTFIDKLKSVRHHVITAEASFLSMQSSFYQYLSTNL